MIARKLLTAGIVVALFVFMLLLQLHRNEDPMLQNMTSSGSSSYRKEAMIETQVSNRVEIQNIIRDEIKEMKKIGVQLDLGNDEMGNLPTGVSEQDKGTFPITEKPAKVKTAAKEKLTFRVRDLDTRDIEKLTIQERLLESETNPSQKSTFCPSEVFLTILVVSHPNSFRRRNNIRNTWASSYQKDYLKLKNRKDFPNKKTYHPKNVVKTVFVVGKPNGWDAKRVKQLEEEVEFGDDLVLGELTEDYRNLTLKTKLGLKWAYYECKSSFIIKTDDDVFINPVMLVEWLKAIPQENVYGGWCNFNSPVIRDKNNKWYVSSEDYKEDRYPGYCLGGGYLMSGDLLSRVVKLSYGRKIFPMEDIYVGLMVKELGVKPRDEKKHFNLVYNGNTPDQCDLNHLYLLHRVLDQNLVRHIKHAREALERC